MRSFVVRAVIDTAVLALAVVAVVAVAHVLGLPDWLALLAGMVVGVLASRAARRVRDYVEGY